VAGAFPFGGTPRHASPVFPGIAVAALLVLVAPLRDRLPAARARAAAVAAAALVAGAPGALALARAEREPRARAALEGQVHAAAYRAAPAPVVTNAQGRSLVSWWLLPGARPARRLPELPRFGVFDYDGIPVVEVANLADAARTAAFYAGAAEASWLFLAYPQGGGAERAARELLGALRGAPGLRVELAARSPFVRESVVVKLVRRPEAPRAGSAGS
jgi:hypothetical protein